MSYQSAGMKGNGNIAYSSKDTKMPGTDKPKAPKKGASVAKGDGGAVGAHARAMSSIKSSGHPIPGSMKIKL